MKKKAASHELRALSQYSLRQGQAAPRRPDEAKRKQPAQTFVRFCFRSQLAAKSSQLIPYFRPN